VLSRSLLGKRKAGLRESEAAEQGLGGDDRRGLRLRVRASLSGPPSSLHFSETHIGGKMRAGRLDFAHHS
jgi:hypothetical protein